MSLDFLSNNDGTAPPKPPKIITYLLTITSASEAKKKSAKHWESISRRIELSCTEPWDTVKAQFLNEISDALSPPQIHFDHYEFSFKIPRAVSEPTRLFSGGDYEFLVRESMKGKSASNVKVQITQKKAIMKACILLSCIQHSAHIYAVWFDIYGFQKAREGECC